MGVASAKDSGSKACGAAGIFEMTRADDGRATFQYGAAVAEGEPHIVWRRIGTQAIFTNP